MSASMSCIANIAMIDGVPLMKRRILSDGR
jgi:hypothetical protein